MLDPAVPGDAAADTAAASGTIPPVPPPVDPLLADSVDEAVVGNPLEDVPEAQPHRLLNSTRDFASLYIRCRSPLELRARRFLSDQRDVDEVVQETFLRLFLAMPEIETELQALAFCRRVLTNLCIDRYRADRRRPQLFELDPTLSAQLPADDFPDHPILQAEDAALVRRALAMLSPLHRAALVKREIEEKPLPVIASELGVPEESVKHLLFRARRSLRRLLVGSAVDPAADLTAVEALQVANKRLGRATLRGAGALIALFVAVVAVAGGLRPSSLANSGNAGGQAGGGPVTGVGARTSNGSGEHIASSHLPLSVGHHSSPTGSQATQHSDAATTPAAPAAPHPGSQAGVGPLRLGTPESRSIPPSSSDFKLSGPLRLRGKPNVTAVKTTTASVRETVSDFSAPTDQGTFELTETVVQPVAAASATGTTAVGATVDVQPAFVIGTSAFQVPVLTKSASLVRNADGTYVVNVSAKTEANPSSNLFPLSSVNATALLSPNLGKVLSEAVTVTASSAPGTPSQPALSTPPASPTSTPPSPSVPTAGPTTPATTCTTAAVPSQDEPGGEPTATSVANAAPSSAMIESSPTGNDQPPLCSS